MYYTNFYDKPFSGYESANFSKMADSSHFEFQDTAFQMLNWCRKCIQWSQFSWKTCIILISMTNGFFLRWPPSAILDFKIQLVSLDKFVSMALRLRSFHAKGDLCIMIWSQKSLNMPILGGGGANWTVGRGALYRAYKYNYTIVQPWATSGPWAGSGLWGPYQFSFNPAHRAMHSWDGHRWSQSHPRCDFDSATYQFPITLSLSSSGNRRSVSCSVWVWPAAKYRNRNPARKMNKLPMAAIVSFYLYFQIQQ